MKDHLGGALIAGDPSTFMPDIWERLILKHRIRSMIDVGSGVGHNTLWFLHHGIDAFAVDGAYQDELVIPPERFRLHDYTEGAYIPDRAFDLCYSSEFVEHVEARFEPNFLATFAACRFLFLTHGTPGQGGVHHVNEQETGYWIERLKEYGFAYDDRETSWMRSTVETSEHGKHYGRKTACFFVKLLK